MRYKRIKFPRDGQTHKTIVEWWYFNGNLKDARGREYAFMDCLFRVNPKKINLPFLKAVPVKDFYFSHNLLSDIRKKKFYSNIYPVVIPSIDSFSRPLFFADYMIPSTKGYINYEIEEISPFRYRIKTDSFDLVLKSKKSPLLLGGKGFLNPSSKLNTYYYSLTDLETEGTITLNGKVIEVKGKSWMDHQWADTPYSKIKWSWFSIQLDNNTEIVCYELVQGDKRIYLANIMDEKGQLEHTRDVVLTPSKSFWASKETGAKYPLSWNLRIPCKNIDLSVKSLIKQQEIVFGPINYWEGPIRISGEVGQQKVEGRGFMELVGYPRTKSLISQYRSKVRGLFSKHSS